MNKWNVDGRYATGKIGDNAKGRVGRYATGKIGDNAKGRVG